MTTKKRPARPGQSRRAAVGGPRVPEADEREPVAPVPQNAEEAFEARDHDRTTEEDEGMEPGELWPREEELIQDERDVEARSESRSSAEDDNDPGEPWLLDQELPEEVVDDENTER